MIYRLPTPGARERVFGPEQSFLGWKARIEWPWTVETVSGFEDGMVIRARTKRQCEDRIAKAVREWWLTHGPPPGGWDFDHAVKLIEELAGEGPARGLLPKP